MESQSMVIAVMTILGAGFSSYVAVKVALAEHRLRIQTLEENQEKLEGRVVRLEGEYFK